MNIQQPFFGAQQSPFVKMGDAVLGVNIPQVLTGINSPEQLVELLQSAQLFQKLQAESAQNGGAVNIGELIHKAAEADALARKNDALSLQVKELENALYSAIQDEAAFTVPSFPQDFQYYGDVGELSDEEVQDVVVTVANTELEEGEFSYVAVGDTAVVRMHDGDRIVTLVAQNYFEHQEILDEETTEVGCGDPDCPCQILR